MESIKISLIQFDIVWENIDANLQKLDKICKSIPLETEIVIFPEMFATGFTMNVDKFVAEDGLKIFNWLKNKAEKYQKIFVGSILIKEHNANYNRMFWIYPNGSFEYYDKKHLFSMENEHKIMTSGEQRVIIPYKNHKFMLQICYDLRFPSWVRNVYDEKTKTFDYDTIIYIANWPEVRKNAYLALLKARAIENQSYVIWVNRIGEDVQKIKYSGNSQLVDYNGTIIAETTAETILSVEINTDKLIAYRNEFKVGLDWD